MSAGEISVIKSIRSSLKKSLKKNLPLSLYSFPPYNTSMDVKDSHSKKPNLRMPSKEDSGILTYLFFHR